MISALRVIEFCAGHRLMNHEGKCRHLHGHNYVAVVEVQGIDRDLDDIGRVIDFGLLKHIVKEWIDTNWDHGFILQATDTAALEALSVVNPSKIFTLPYSPTAENLARYLGSVVLPQLLGPLGIATLGVSVGESSGAEATWRP